MRTDEIEAPRLSPKILKAIDGALEEVHEQGLTKAAGDAMVGAEMKKTQVRGLENLIAATTRFSEIINYIKNQVGKGRKEWRAPGPILLTQLEGIETKAAEIAGEDAAVRLDVKLRLARGWARQVVAHYLYGREDEGDHDETR